jgi:hypothetical protein
MSSVKPEDILPDGEDFVEIQNQKLRKGTVAAILANANILEDLGTTEDEKEQALKAIRSLVPALIALQMHQHVIWKNPLIQTIIDEEIK